MNSFKLLKVTLKGKSITRKATKPRILATLFVAVLFFGIGVAEYFGFIEFFRALNDFASIKAVIVDYSLYSLFLFLFIVVFASVLLSGSFIILNRKDSNLLLPLPLSNLSLFNAHFLEQILISSWIALLFGVPAILSLLTLNASALLIFDGIIFFLILIASAITIGNICLLIIYSATRKVTQKLGISLIIIVILLLGYITLRQIMPHEIFDLLASNNPSGNTQALNNLTNHNQYWPSGWFVNILSGDLGFQAGDIFSRLWLVVFLIGGLILQTIIAKKYYRKILQSAQSNPEKVKARSSVLINYRGNYLLLMKEWLFIVRERSNLNQFLFFIFLLGMYLSFIFSTKTLNVSADPIWTPRIIIFIILTLCYFITLLALRFIYPQTSLEKKSGWFFLSIPRVNDKIFSIKIISWLIPTTIIIEVIILLTALGFNLSWGFILPLMLLTPFITLFIVTFAQSFGTLFPVRAENNAEELSTTPQGLSLFAFLSLYTLMIIWLIRPEIIDKINSGGVGISFGINYWLIIVLSLLLTWFFWSVGSRKYKKMFLA